MEVISLNKPGELHFLAPALAAGTCQVEVRTILIGRKELASVRLDAEISVVGG